MVNWEAESIHINIWSCIQLLKEILGIWKMKGVDSTEFHSFYA